MACVCALLLRALQVEMPRGVEYPDNCIKGRRLILNILSLPHLLFDSYW